MIYNRLSQASSFVYLYHVIKTKNNMGIISIALILTAGFCIGISLFYLFLGLRQKGLNLIYLAFSLFALSYGITAMGSMVRFNSLTLEQYVSNARWGYPAFSLAYIFLIWFVAIYAKIRVRLFLWGMTAVFLFIAIRMPQEIGGIFYATLPWGEKITLSTSNGNTWLLFWIAVPIVSGFILYACIRQYRRGERMEALVLGLGFIFLAIAIIFDIFVDMGVINFFYMSDFGFLPLAIAMGIQLSNRMVVIQEQLKQYQQGLENLVAEKTYELELTNTALRQSERDTRALLDATSDTAMLLTPSGDILAINMNATERLGLKLSEAVGRNVFEIISQEVAASRKEKFQELVISKKPLSWEDRRIGINYRNRMYPVLDDAGEVSKIALYASDITDLKRAEEELRRRVSDLNTIIQITEIISMESDIVSALHLAAERIVTLFQACSMYIIYTASQDENLEIMSGFDAETGPIEPHLIDNQLDQLLYIQKGVRQGKALIVNDFSSLTLEPEVSKNFFDETKIKSIMLAPLLVKGIGNGVIMVNRSHNQGHFEHHDLNLLEAVSGYISAAIDNARLVFNNIEAAAIEERSRLARDLHDAVTQTIYSASLIAEVLPQVWARSPEEGQRNLTKLRALVRGALAEMRMMLFELRPAAVELANIEILLGQLGDALHGRTRIMVEIVCDNPPDLPLPVKIAFYRIAQEAVNNIIKHAGATQTQIVLKEQSGHVFLQVMDNGQGFDPKKINGGLGLDIMRERAGSINANLEIESQPNQGTKLTVNWQIPHQAESEI